MINIYLSLTPFSELKTFNKLKAFSLTLVLALTLAACGGGDSDSGGMDEPTLPGTNIPAIFVGTYSGTLTVTAAALGLSETDSFPITITVTSDGMIRFDGDDPDETFTAGLTNEGRFVGVLPVEVDECSGQLSTSGNVDGTTASGEVSGEGRCDVDGVVVTVTLEGTFTATK